MKKICFITLLLCTLFILCSAHSFAAEIQSVSVKIKEPSIGAKPDYNPFFYPSAYSYSADYSEADFRNDVRWYDTTDSVYLNPDTGVFVRGHEYKVTIYATPEAGYAYSSGTIAKVNWNDAVSSLYGGQLKIEYTFPPAGIITEATIVWIEAPIAGNTPDYDPEVISDAKYYSDDYSYLNLMKNDIEWKDVTADKRVAVTEPFVAGHQYRVTVYYTAKDGYVFTEETAGYITPSGGPYFGDRFKTEARMYNDQLCLTYTFPATPKSIPEISITCTPPIFGKNPDFSPVLPSGANYEIYDYSNSEYTHGVGWYDQQTKKVLHASDTFSAPNREYTIFVWIKPKDGYTFNGPGYINGIEASVSSHWNGMRLYSLTFDKALQEITAVSVTITPPKAGEKPDVNPKLPSGAKYHIVYPYDASAPNVIWDDSTDSREMDPHKDTFKAGHTYEVTLWLVPDEGYMFAEGAQPRTSVTTFLNGEDVGSLRFREPHCLLIHYTFPTPGDVNGDNKVNRLDYVILSRYLAKWPGYASKITDMSRAELDGKPGITAADRRILGRIVAGK